ncbi:MAG: hypothetical protein H7843_09655 [Nitrospirota bacterium]|uniref:Uncharacterized protein n=1 Tax=Candidatus Magnetominusculus xianensis TaxID=1748249 RepID=A0ABR5SCB5_9BACT|nr:hypothetical protein [Candidatus Magnetominusculus xianensis]KWT79383.1 hypothetical protein ASN18_2757 [Candidatus Magnetominusculus xianensis]MBF0405490.1 hypothetical protein [Nitrospirota bacterium]
MAKVLYILKQEPDATAKTIIETQKTLADVTVIDMRTDKDYDKIIGEVVSSDKIITW